MYFKDFDEWNTKKKSLNASNARIPFFKEKEVWWLSIGVNVGYEEDGKHDKYLRPVLIIRKFSKDLFLGVPLSTKLKSNRYYVAILLKGELVSVLISQIRSFSSKRLLCKIGELDENTSAYYNSG